MDSDSCRSNNHESRLHSHGQSSKADVMELQYLKEITNDFSDERILGQGGFGVVYKGVLQNGEMVAIKKLLQPLPNFLKQFKNEVDLLVRLKHPNIVRLIGYCYETQNVHMDYNGKFIFAEVTQSLLCLEFLPKGSLDSYISDESCGLDWHTRYTIIEGICNGLQYLHEQIKPIMHLDLKPANILLTDNMVPKVTDFGLSRLLDQQQTMCTLLTTGTRGYMPPEYIQGGTITLMSDIFSLGVIILEIVTGHRDYPDVTRTPSEDFIELTLKKWSDVLEKAPVYTSVEIGCQQIKKCIQIGLICVNPDRLKRPTAAKVIKMLQGQESMDFDGGNEVTSSASQSRSCPRKIIDIYPLEVCFSSKPDKPSLVKLTNKTDGYVAFHIKATRAINKYLIEPASGFLWPRSPLNVVVTMEERCVLPPDLQLGDEFVVQSIMVSVERLVSEHITEDTFNKVSSKAVQKVNLSVVYGAEPPLLLPKGSEETETTYLQQLEDFTGSLFKAEREIQKGPHENLQSFLDAVDRLRSIERFFSSNRSYSSSDEVLSHVNALLSKVLVKMEGEFQNQLSQRSKPMEPDRLFDCLPSTLRPSSAVYSPPALIEPKFVPLLAKLAQQLVQAGCQQQCAEIYSEARASALESSLKNLGVEKLSKDEVQKMPWEILESKIGDWIHFMRIAVKLLFAAERQLYDQVFECSQSLRDKCFSAITKNSLATLLSFGEAIPMSKISPEKLFLLLDMYEIMCELQTEFDTIFVGESWSQMRDSALSLTKCLAQTAQKTFSDFEEAVEKDATENFHTDGTVHPLTSYVINYVKFLLNYQSTLKQLFQEFKREDGTGSELASVTMSIMQALQNNLDATAKQYKDPALMHIFLMNNIQYIVIYVCRSEAKDLLGDDWIKRHRRIIQQNANQYRRVAWSKVLQCLSAQGLTSSGGITGKAVKERFRSFNVLFEEIYQKQCDWSVPDSELRESLRLAVVEILLPAYRSFQMRFGRLIENSKAPGKYVKHTPEQLEMFIYNLFEGKQERT